jgi:hypothetical protein
VWGLTAPRRAGDGPSYTKIEVAPSD